VPHSLSTASGPPAGRPGRAGGAAALLAPVAAAPGAPGAARPRAAPPPPPVRAVDLDHSGTTSSRWHCGQVVSGGPANSSPMSARDMVSRQAVQELSISFPTPVPPARSAVSS